MSAPPALIGASERKLITVATLLVTRIRDEYFIVAPVNSNSFCKWNAAIFHRNWPFEGFIIIWCHSDDSDKPAADSPQITGRLFQENKQSFSFFPGHLGALQAALVPSRAAGILCFNWRGWTAWWKPHLLHVGPSVHGETWAWRRLIGPRTSEHRRGRPALGLNVNGDKAFYYQIFMNGCASLLVLYVCG